MRFELRSVRLGRTSFPVLLLMVGMCAGAFAKSFDLQGHRGARGLAPENTIAGFEKAIEIGVTTLELDVVMTKDGHIVVSHEQHLMPELARDAQGAWLKAPSAPLRTMTLAAIQSHDVGRYRPGSPNYQRYPSYKPVDGERIPTLDEVFSLIRKRQADVFVSIETKLAPNDGTNVADLVRAIVAVLDKWNMRQSVTIASFDWRSLAEVKRVAPDISITFLSAQQQWLDNISSKDGAKSPWTGHNLNDFGGSLPRMIHALNGNVWAPFIFDASAESVREAHELGLKVVVWTANDPDHLRRALKWNVDGVITDRPDLYKLILETEYGFNLKPQLRSK